ncbi:hypothetical protein [Streptomyces sp. NPDC047028]|uniref:hypothetical protein n=1 Tax=Streptomyces sp. NPDC047028 TaxID=3155793 RepID=UPI0033D24C0A
MALTAVCGAGWLLAGPAGLLATGIAAAVTTLLVVRLFRVPPASRTTLRRRGDVPFADAPYVRYRKLFSGLSWGQVSARQFDYATRPHLERVTAALLRARCRIDPVANPGAARELLGAELWALADPARPRSDDSHAPAVPLSEVARLMDRLEEL